MSSSSGWQRTSARRWRLPCRCWTGCSRSRSTVARGLVWLVGRAAALLFSSLLVSLALFLGVHFLPGDPVRQETHQTLAQYHIALHRAGLDLPLWQQYLHVMQRLLDGDLAQRLLPEAINSA